MVPELESDTAGKQLPPILKDVVVLVDLDFDRLAHSKRGERVIFVPVKVPMGARKGALVYVEGTSQKTVLSDNRQYRLGAVIHGVRTVAKTRAKSIILERGYLMLTDDDLKRLPKPGSLIID